jgi:hypothetical protein
VAVIETTWPFEHGYTHEQREGWRTDGRRSGPVTTVGSSRRTLLGSPWAPPGRFGRPGGPQSPCSGLVEAKGIEPSTSCMPCEPTSPTERRPITKSLTFQR